MMKVINAEIVTANRRDKIKGGTYIDYISSDNVIKGAIVDIRHNDRIHHFEVTDIIIDNQNLKVTAIETGYWARKFDQDKEFDLRHLIGLEVVRVDEEERLIQIRKESCYC